MISYCFIAADKNIREEKVKDFLASLQIDPLDITTITKESVGKKEQSLSIGIDAIKLLQKNAYLSPIKSTQKAIVITDAENLTVEAQNALLKTLEEPPAQTVIVLSAESESQLLPTVLSRCRILKTYEQDGPQTIDQEKLFVSFLAALSDFHLRDALVYAENVSRDKASALTWLQDCSRILHHQLLLQKDHNDQVFRLLALVLRRFQEAHRVIRTTNASVRLVLEHTFLSLLPKGIDRQRA